MPDVLDDTFTFYRNRSIAGGMNSKVFATQIRDDQVAELYDANLDTPGQREKRPGYTLIGDDKGSDIVVALADFKPDGGTQKLLHRAGTNLRFWTGSGNWSDISTGLVDGPDADIVQAFNLAFIFQGSGGNVQSYDGSSLSDEGNAVNDPAKCTHGIWAANRLWTNDTANPLHICSSDQLAPQTFASRVSNSLKLDSGSGAFVNGILQWSSNEIVVATDREIYVIGNITDATRSNFTVERVIPNYGCIARRTLQRVGNDVWWMSPDGHIRSLVRTAEDNIRGEEQPITEAIEPFIDLIDRSVIQFSSAAFLNGKYYVAVPIDNGRNSHMIKIDPVTRGITIQRNHNIRSFAVSDITGNENRLYGGESSGDTLVYRMLSGTSDNGTAITYSETTKRIDFDAPEVDKNPQVLEVEAIATDDVDLTVEAQLDGGGWATVGTLSLESGAPTLPVDLPFDLVSENATRGKFDLSSLGRCRDLQLRLTQDTLDAEVKLIGYTITAFLENFERG